MKRFIVLLMVMTITSQLFAQSYDQERVALRNFLVRMYKVNPFEGVKIVSDYENYYVLSAVLVKIGTSESTTNRIAQVKSQRQVSQYLNGIITIESETIVRTTQNAKEEKTIEEITDVIREHSIGFTKAMEALATIDVSNNQKCYMFFRKVEEMKE